MSPCPGLRHSELRTLLQGHAVLTVTLLCLRTAVIRISLEVGQRVKPGTPEAEGQVRGLGETGPAAAGAEICLPFSLGPCNTAVVHRV